MFFFSPRSKFSLPLKTTCAGIPRIPARGRCCISEEHPLAQLVPSFQLQRDLEYRFARLPGTDWEMKRWPSCPPVAGDERRRREGGTDRAASRGSETIKVVSAASLCCCYCNTSRRPHYCNLTE